MLTQTVSCAHAAEAVFRQTVADILIEIGAGLPSMLDQFLSMT